jgi:flagellar basal-body rod protein FlgB
MIEGLFNSSNYAAAKRLLDASVVRQEGIAANLANLETPGYKRVDLPKDFAKQFAASVRAGEGASVEVPKLAVDATATSTRKDGNTVELDRELLALNRNNTEYETLTELVSGSIKQLRLAVTGRNA